MLDIWHGDGLRGGATRAGSAVILAGDYNVMPTELDVYKPERRKGDQCPRLLWEQAGCPEGRDEELYFRPRRN